MARAVGSGVISFGLVSIPVRLFPATQPSSGVSFHLLHRKDGARLKQQYVCPRDNEIVPRSDMTRGYEFARDQYVVFSPEELKALEEAPSRNIEITEFIPLSQVDPVYFDKPYYLGFEGGGEKAYRLLADSMRETGRCALARYAARGKQYLVLLRPYENGLVMQQLLYADEVRPFQEVPVPDVPARDRELELAKQLIAQISSDRFDPSAYRDDVKDRIRNDVQRKIEGQQITVSAPPEEPAQIIDLMQALKASLGEVKESGPSAARQGAAESAQSPAGEQAEVAAGEQAEVAAGETEAGAVEPPAAGHGEARRPARRAGTRAARPRASQPVGEHPRRAKG